MSAALARARAMIGVRFRARGRTAEGLDCVGLAGWAYCVPVPATYAMRSDDRERVAGVAAALGLAAVDAGRQPGDLLLLASGPGQLHLGIDSGTGLVHADAMLRRVVERPDPLPWPVIGRWRRLED